ncbi:MAG: FadR/GntR family transcriptional regulator [Pseudomonadota bacterium]
MESLFNRIELQKVTDEVANQLRTLIKDGKLAPGAKLPPERTLAEMMGVGRSSLREAVNILQTQGFVDSKKRKGIFVRSLGSPMLSNPLRQILEEDKDKLIQLYDIRKDIELATAAKAAELRKSQDLKAMKKFLDKMSADSGKPVLHLSDDLEFHLAIARSTGNFFRNHILQSIFDLSDVYLRFLVEKLVSDRQHILSVLDQHQDIFNAIENQDPGKAREAMNDHLTYVEEKWKAYVAA